MTWDAVVVGAGVGGLTAAMMLAAAGRSVLVLEAGPRLGGKAGQQEVDGVSFDTGPSVVTLPALIDQAFQAAGTALEDEIKLVRPDPGFRYLYPDGTALDVHFRPEDTIASVTDALGDRAGRELKGFLDYSRRIWEVSAPWFVTGDAPTVTTLLRAGPRLLGLLPAIDPLRTLQQAVDARVQDPRLRWLLARYATYNGSDPRRCPAALNCIAWVELGLGVYGIEGGLHQLPLALARVGARHGAVYRLNCPVDRLVVEGGRLRAVQAQGEELRTQAVVVNADVTHLWRDLLKCPPSQVGLAHLPPSTSGWTGVLRARRGATPRRAHEVIFPERYEAEFEDLFDAGKPPEDPTIYLCAQESAHQRPGWPEHEIIFAMANAPAEPESAPTPAEVWQRLEAKIEARLRASQRWVEGDGWVWTRTPPALAQQFPGSRGSIYGAASNSPTAAFRRPPNRLSHLPGLYLASGGAHPGGGVPLCVLSGRQAALRILHP